MRISISDAPLVEGARREVVHLRRGKLLEWGGLAAILLLAAALHAQPVQRFDIVVYGGTAGGSIAAIAAAHEGMRVALLEPGRHAGGMLTGGLGRTDMDRQENVIGGFSRQFFERVGKHYGEAVSWRFEPSVAERTLNEWLKEGGCERVRVQNFISNRNMARRYSEARPREPGLL